MEHLDELETIPPYNQGKLSLEDYRAIKTYLSKVIWNREINAVVLYWTEEAFSLNNLPGLAQTLSVLII